MADSYADFALATGLNDGTSWANAYHTTTPTQNALTSAGAGGRVFIKTDSAGTNKDTASGGDVTLTSPGTVLAPTEVYCCKSTTTNEPPVTGDLVVKGVDVLPDFETTGSNSSIFPVGYAQVYGLDLSSTEHIQMNGATAKGWVFQDSVLRISIADTTTGNNLLVGDTGSSEKDVLLHLRNTDFELGRASAIFLIGKACHFWWEGGALIAPSGVTILFDGPHYGRTTLQGVDLTAMGSSKILIDVNDAQGSDDLFMNCELPASLTVVSGTWDGQAARVRLHGCSTDTAISTSVPDLEEYATLGSVIADTTHVRTGGATDGAAGLFAWAMTPNANAPQFPNFTLRSPPMGIWLDGTETTVTIPIANDAAESSPANDMHDNEVWAEVIASDSTLDTAQYVLANDRMALLGTAADQANDSGSTWGSGANNHQSLVVTIAPGYEGPAICYVHCAERAASPKTVYVDPKPVTS